MSSITDFTQKLFSAYGQPSEWEQLGSAYAGPPAGSYDYHDPIAEGMGCQSYVYLAQLMEILLGYEDAPERISTSEIHMGIHVLQFALTWMDYSGFRYRHPDLQVMPEEIPPTEFAGGPEHTREWVMKELDLWVGGEQARNSAKLN